MGFVIRETGINTSLAYNYHTFLPNHRGFSPLFLRTPPTFLFPLPLAISLALGRMSAKYEQDFNLGSIEKASPKGTFVKPADNRYNFDQSDIDHVQRRLKQRHVQMSVLLRILSWLIVFSPVLNSTGSP
jgi:hypothetical protein